MKFTEEQAIKKLIDPVLERTGWIVGENMFKKNIQRENKLLKRRPYNNKHGKREE